MSSPLFVELSNTLDSLIREYEDIETEDISDILIRDPLVQKMSQIRIYLRDKTETVVSVPVGSRSGRVCRAAAAAFDVSIESGYRLFLQEENLPERIIQDNEVPSKIQIDILRQRKLDYSCGFSHHNSIFKFVFSNMPLWCWAGQNLQEISIPGKNLTSFPLVILKTKGVETLILRNNRISSLPIQMQSMVSLKKLQLTKCQLHVVPEVISMLVSLVDLDLGQNGISFIPPEIGNCQSLKYLSLSVNRIANLPKEISLLPLEQISLTSNQLTEVPKSLTCIGSLTEVRLAGNYIKTVCEEIGNLSKLLFLDLRNNLINELPQSLNALSTLESLNVRKNYLKELPAMKQLTNCLNCMENCFESLPFDFASSSKLLFFKSCKLKEVGRLCCPNVIGLNMSENCIQTIDLSGMPALTSVNLSCNMFERIPAFSPITRVSDLYLQNNRISKLGAELSGMAISKLDLHNNRISDVPSVFSKLPNLQFLNLSGNHIKSLPKSFEKMTLLKELSVAFNRIGDGSWSAITSLKNLRSLNISYNLFTKVDNGLIKSCNLQQLYLSGNKIGSCFSNFEYGRLTNMKEFYAASCGLQFFPESFKLWKHLAVLDLSANNIGFVPRIIGELPNLRDLHLSYNGNLDKLPDEIQNCRQLKMLELEGTSCSVNSVPGMFNNYVTETTRSKSRFPVGVCEMQGKRNHMEDALTIKGSFLGDTKSDYFAIYDGHGGTEVAKFLSTALHALLADRLHAGNTPELALESATLLTCMVLKNKKMGFSCGSTAASLLMIDDNMYFSNTGDARSVISRQKKAFRCSYDHKPTNIEEEQRIKMLGGFVTEEGRVNGILAVSRSIGDFMLSPYVCPEPYINTMVKTNDDEFVIIACDGVWDVMSDQQAVDIVHSVDDPALAALKLRDIAYSYGSMDNITAMVIKFK
eukprot:TRINITY_DN2310_c0_g1_i1.p1 TRINITY_DN2310_c0_g1~~TRINITY_DN2310_c0_g1_i1.p1  ORF type:complete len:922 (-),score=64.78 TRINITY_DN2310_c0_g1_i1:19-2784(-)